MADTRQQAAMANVQRSSTPPRHTHASNILYFKRRRQQMVEQSTAPGEDGTPQSISDGVFNSMLALICAFVMVWVIYSAMQAFGVVP